MCDMHSCKLQLCHAINMLDKIARWNCRCDIDLILIKVPIPVGESGPHLLHCSLDTHESAPKLHLSWFICFSTAHRAHHRQTDRQTHHARCDICSNRSHPSYACKCSLKIKYGGGHTMRCRHWLARLWSKTHVHRGRLLTAAGPSTDTATSRLTEPCLSRCSCRTTTTGRGWRAAWTNVWRTVRPILCWVRRRWTICWH